ncbi:MAG: hypothetical protein JWM11_5077 [Planctomycetaceae bacterium]|nr:hypothetical protein [Planctomycetaceae bacterium]
MANAVHSTLITPRDIEILSSLDRHPLTIEQLLALSETFSAPFTSDSRVRGRMQRLHEAGWIRRYRYATALRGTPADYFLLTPLGFQILHGANAVPPSKRAFSEIGVARHHHTRSLTTFIIKTAISGHRRGIAMIDYCRENSLRLEIGTEYLFPDCAFQMQPKDGASFNFLVEIDCGTERIRSKKDADSLERKIRLYDRYQDQLPSRFRVLFVTTRSEDRVHHILEAAAAVVRNPRRGLIYAVSLEQYLKHSDPLTSPCFLDHRMERRSLIPVTPNIDRENNTQIVTDETLSQVG